MDLELVTVERGSRTKYAPPFDEHDGYTDRWWNRPMGDEPESRYIQVLSEGVQVARVELDGRVGIAHYEGVPNLGTPRSKSSSSRCRTSTDYRGLGRQLFP